MYFCSEAGVLFALDSIQGKEVWRMDLGARVTASPALADGVLYIATESGEVLALR